MCVRKWYMLCIGGQKQWRFFLGVRKDIATNRMQQHYLEDFQICQILKQNTWHSLHKECSESFAQMCS